MSANWSRRGIDQRVHYILNKNVLHPDLYLIDEESTDDVLQVHVSRENFEPPKPTVKTRHISSYNLSIEREKSVSDGVEVNSDIWSTLIKIAKNNLVENSEQSEKLGAGGN